MDNQELLNQVLAAMQEQTEVLTKMIHTQISESEAKTAQKSRIWKPASASRSRTTSPGGLIPLWTAISSPTKNNGSWKSAPKTFKTKSLTCKPALPRWKTKLPNFLEAVTALIKSRQGFFFMQSALIG